MTSPRLYGPFQLTLQGIEAHLQSDSPGVYALGNSHEDLFITAYIGRAADLREDLKAHISGPYQQFKFAYAVSDRDAFEKQCELYHEFIGLDNERHPCPLTGTFWLCPRCKTLPESY